MRHEDRVRADLDHLWHPFTASSEWSRPHDVLLAVGGEGPWLLGHDGRRYLDGTAALWCLVHGYGNQRITDAVERQARRLAHSTLLGLSHPPAVELAVRLARLAGPPLRRVYFASDGASAVEAAMRMALQYQAMRGEKRRTGFLVLEDAYHGDTLACSAVGRSPAFHRFLPPPILPVDAFPAPWHMLRRGKARNTAEAVERSLQAMERLLETRGSTSAAFLFEPGIQGAAGMLPQPEAFPARAAALARKAGLLVIADEIAVGLGRTGRWFVSQPEAAPDLLCLGKGLTGGTLPLSAVLATEDLYRAFAGTVASGRPFFHGHTFAGNPVACAAATANLDLMEEENITEHVRALGTILGESLRARLGAHPNVREIRGRGAMWGVELQRDPSRDRPFPPEARIGRAVCLAARRHRVLLRPLGDTVVVMPPLAIGEPEVRFLVDALDRALEEVLPA